MINDNENETENEKKKKIGLGLVMDTKALLIKKTCKSKLL